MSERSVYRLAGLEADNLLAFVALLGLLRTIEHARPRWRPRAAWTVDDPPVRPTLTVASHATESDIVAAVAEGLRELARLHQFGQLKDLKLTPKEAAEHLRIALTKERYTSDLWAALTSDVAIRDKNRTQEAEPTPLCLLFGQGHMHFMSRLASVPQESTPPSRGVGRQRIAIGETDCLREALFEPWKRLDATFSFRWDPHEDVRYALRATDPTDSKTKEKTQHGANRLAAIGLSVLTVVPRLSSVAVRLGIIGGMRERRGRFAFTWPIWRDPISLAAIRAMLGHAGLGKRAAWDALGIVELRRARRISVGKFMNFTTAESMNEPEAESMNEPEAESRVPLRR